MKKTVFTLVLSLAFIICLFAQAKKPLTPTQLSVVRGKKVFMTTCVTCHQRDGGGVPRLNPPLINTEYVLGDKTRLIQIVLKGLNQPLEIEGDKYTNAMPSFAQLTDQQIADVLTYVRNSFGNKAASVTLAQVKTARASVK